MSKIMGRLMGERLRLVQVRQGLSAALEHQPNNEDLRAFYIAESNYFEAAMERLHRQDNIMLAKLADKLATANIDPGSALSEVEERLAGNQVLLTAMLGARDALLLDDDSALTNFETIAREYTQYIIANMGHHPASANLAQQHFDEQDWEHMADFNDPETEGEATLFDIVLASAPASAQEALTTAPQRGPRPS